MSKSLKSDFLPLASVDIVSLVFVYFLCPNIVSTSVCLNVPQPGPPAFLSWGKGNERGRGMMTKISVVIMFLFLSLPTRVHLSWTICQVSFNASVGRRWDSSSSSPKGSFCSKHFHKLGKFGCQSGLPPLLC